MKAGILKDSIEIQRATIGLDDFGQQIKTFALLSTQRADVKVIEETENQSGGKYDGRTKYQVKIRYTDVTKKDRIVWDSLNLEITQIIDPSRRRTELKITAYSDE